MAEYKKVPNNKIEYVDKLPEGVSFDDLTKARQPNIKLEDLFTEEALNNDYTNDPEVLKTLGINKEELIKDLKARLAAGESFSSIIKSLQVDKSIPISIIPTASTQVSAHENLKTKKKK